MKKMIFKFLIYSVAAVMFIGCQTKPEPKKVVTPENALQSYLDNGDNSFKWEVQDSTQTDGAKLNKAIVSIIWQVPNQPRYGGKTEDELISYTLHNFQNDSDYTWPLLFPMTKSAIKAMDAVQEFSTQKLNSKVNQFVISGASKRGWTTWLTGAHDSRVKAIAPMVIDMLNWPLNLEYHKVTWGDYSIQIEDYVKLGIVQKANTTEGKKVATMVDPYSYRSSLTMPKMILMGTNDEYWPVDAVKNYIDSIPGENYICYTPNAGHDMGDKNTALSTLSAFFGTTISNGTYPEFDYSVSEENGKITLTVKTTSEILEDAVLWCASSTDREFRDKVWSSVSLGKTNVSEFSHEIDYPENGFMAFYIDLKYKAPFTVSFTQSTRIFLTTSEKVLLLRGE